MESSRHAVAREGWLTAAGERAGGRDEGEGERFEAWGMRLERCDQRRPVDVSVTSPLNVSAMMRAVPCPSVKLSRVLP